MEEEKKTFLRVSDAFSVGEPDDSINKSLKSAKETKDRLMLSGFRRAAAPRSPRLPPAHGFRLLFANASKYDVQFCIAWFGFIWNWTRTSAKNAKLIRTASHFQFDFQRDRRSISFSNLNYVCGSAPKCRNADSKEKSVALVRFRLLETRSIVTQTSFVPSALLVPSRAPLYGFSNQLANARQKERFKVPQNNHRDRRRRTFSATHLQTRSHHCNPLGTQMRFRLFLFVSPLIRPRAGGRLLNASPNQIYY